MNKLVFFRVCVKDLGQMKNSDFGGFRQNIARVTDGLIEGGFVACLPPGAHVFFSINQLLSQKFFFLVSLRQTNRETESIWTLAFYIIWCTFRQNLKTPLTFANLVRRIELHSYIIGIAFILFLHHCRHKYHKYHQITSHVYL